MCRRFWIPALQPDIETLFLKYFGLDLSLEENGNFNRECLPFNEIPGVICENGGYKLKQMYWNLIPYNSAEFKPKRTWFNARAEKLTEPYQEMLLRGNRCVFIANRFSEKQYEFKLSGDHIMFLGGLYDVWKGEKYSCTIITVPANKTVLRAHDRMPFIMQKENLVSWLDPENTNEDELRKMINPFAAGKMEGKREDNQTELF